MTEGSHFPVMLSEVLSVLHPVDGGIYIDGTFGAGGYSTALLQAAQCRVFAIDRDPVVLKKGQDLAQQFEGRLTLAEGCFGDMVALAGAYGLTQVDGIALDIGVSSMQLDEPARGFSFMHDGPLDMRMSGSGPSATDVVNTLDEAGLARILFIYGEERRSRAVARAIVNARDKARITRTRALADIVSDVLGARKGARIHPATKTFQALRIYVNDELRELAKGLAAAERMLKEGGRLAVVAFHSLEDRLVKRFLNVRSGHGHTVSRHAPSALLSKNPEKEEATFDLLFRGAKKPAQVETGHNVRSRSARLRGARRTGVSARAFDFSAFGFDALPVLEGGHP